MGLKSKVSGEQFDAACFGKLCFSLILVTCALIFSEPSGKDLGSVSIRIEILGKIWIFKRLNV